MKFQNRIMIFAAVVILGRCGADPGEKNTAFNDQLQGKWATACVERAAEFGLGDPTEHGHAIRNWDFSSSTEFTYTEIHYSKDTCQPGSEAVTLFGSGTYELGDEFGANDGRHLKVTFASFMAIVKDDDLATALATGNYCNISDWQVDEQVSLIEKSCVGQDNQTLIFPTKTNVYSEGVELSGATMWMGKKPSPFSPEKPTEIDATLAYSKR